MSNGFLAGLDQSDPVLVDAPRGEGTLVVAFGGFFNGLGVPLFEFFRTLEQWPIDKAFVRDFARAWYHAGVAGHPSIGALAEHLSALSRGHRRVVYLGNSMGGYAAILFGCLAGATDVLAFSAQTTIAPADRTALGDDRWQDRMEAILALSQHRADLFDVRPLLEGRRARPRVRVYHNRSDPLDAAHANRLANLSDCIVYPRSSGLGHQLLREMRDSGELGILLTDVLGRA